MFRVSYYDGMEMVATGCCLCCFGIPSPLQTEKKCHDPECHCHTEQPEDMSDMAALTALMMPPIPTPAGMELAVLSEWVDQYPPNAARDPEARLWGRMSKVAEEVGELIAAVIGATDQNPRKGKTHTMDDVAKELLDIALTVLCGYEHLTGNQGVSITALYQHINRTVRRAREHRAGDNAS